MLGGVWLHAQFAMANDRPDHEVRLRLVRELLLTDLCLVTEARYTRNLTMADLHSPLQEHPLSLEHFPSGALITPPPMLLRSHVTSR